MVDLKRKIFPQKLWEIVNDRRYDSALKWADDGSSFYIFDSELSKLCLGKENNLFFTKQPKSFVRQLHLYGFKKINKNQFKHRHFHRDTPNSVTQIKRGYAKLPSPIISPTTMPEMITLNDNSRLMQVQNSLDNSLSDHSLSNYSMEIEQPLQSSICSLCVCAGCCAL